MRLILVQPPIGLASRSPSAGLGGLGAGIPRECAPSGRRRVRRKVRRRRVRRRSGAALIRARRVFRDLPPGPQGIALVNPVQAPRHRFGSLAEEPGAELTPCGTGHRVLG
jgi:hypothetical protein